VVVQIDPDLEPNGIREQDDARSYDASSAGFTTNSTRVKIHHETVTNAHLLKENPLGLGRWTWAIFTGKQGLKTRIISGYWPVRDRSNQAGTIFSQQEKYFTDHGEAWDPRSAFLDDIKTLISEWHEAGDTIILGLDLNNNKGAAKKHDGSKVGDW
jgi:hypothetical protein